MSEFPTVAELQNAADLFVMKKAASDTLEEAIKAMSEKYDIKASILTKVVSIWVNDQVEVAREQQVKEVREQVESLLGILSSAGENE